MDPRFEKPNETRDVKVDADTGEEVVPDEETPAKDTKTELETPDQSEIVMALMSDPDIQSLVNARREGKTTKVVVEDESGPELDPDPELDLGTDDPEITGAIKQIMTMISEKLDPMGKRLEGLENLAAGFEKREVDSQITTLGTKHKDFEKYRGAMAELSKKVTGLGLEELYLLAKHQSGDLSLESPSTDSERPTPTSRRPMSRDKKKDPVRGRRAFAALMTDALEKTIP